MYQDIKNFINSNITANGSQSITGQILQSALIEMINVLGTGARFMGIAQPSTVPNSGDFPMVYVATSNGTYINFGNQTLNDGISLLYKLNTDWQVNQLISYDNLQSKIHLINSLYDAEVGFSYLYLPLSGSAGRYSLDLSGYATQAWVQNQNYATQTWVQNQNFVNSNVLNGYQTKFHLHNSQTDAEVGFSYLYLPLSGSAGRYSLDLSGYATQAWVQAQGYLTSIVLTGYATQTWVQNQNYATQTWVQNRGYVNPSWIQAQGFLTADSLSDYALKTWVQSQNYLPIINGSKIQFGDEGYKLTITSDDSGCFFEGGNFGYTFDGIVYATGFAKLGGTSLQFLKADGSIDSNTYLTQAVLNDYASKEYVQLYVQSQGYLTNAALSDYALKTWVQSQNYVTLSMLNGYASVEYVQLWVQNQNYATQSWVQSQNYLPIIDGNSIKFGEIGYKLTITSDDSGCFFEGGNFGYSFDGACYATAFNQVSDKRLKHDIKEIDIKIEDIAKLPAVSFIIKDSECRKIGTIAQDLQEVMPEVVSELGKEKLLSVDYSSMSAVSVILLAREIVELRKEIDIIRSKLGDK